MKKLLALTLLTSLTLSPVLAAKKHVRFADENEIIEISARAEKEKPQGRLAQAWETIKEYTVPAAAFAALIFLGWQWKKHVSRPVIHTIRTKDDMEAVSRRVGPDGERLVQAFPNHILVPEATPAAVAHAANQARNGLHLYCVPVDYAHNGVNDPRIVILIDRRTAQPYYAAIGLPSANAPLTGQPLRDFFNRLDPEVRY